MNRTILHQMRLFREPLVHFGILGGLMFVLWGLVHKGGQGASAVSAAPLSRTVTLSTKDVDGLRADFRAAWKRQPDPGELGELVQTFVDEEVLYREAVAQGLERADPLVRRRLIEKMTALTRPVAPTQEPSRDQLRRWYLIYAHRFRRPTTVTFEQLFFDPQRRPDAGAAAAQALAGLARAKPSDPPPPTGDAFVLSAATNEKTQLELAHLLGETFAQAVLTAPVGSWSGPVRSTYGIHLVRVVRRTPERLPPFEEIEKTVRADWLTVETRGQRAAAEVLLPRYQLSLPAEVRRELAGAPALAPYLARAR